LVTYRFLFLSHVLPLLADDLGASGERGSCKSVRGRFKSILTGILLTEHGSAVVVVEHVGRQGTLGSVLVALLLSLLLLLVLVASLTVGHGGGLCLGLGVCRAGFVYRGFISSFFTWKATVDTAALRLPG